MRKHLKRKIKRKIQGNKNIQLHEKKRANY